MREYFIYIHTTLDTNEVFYVGRGTKKLNVKTKAQLYRRAYRKDGKTDAWRRKVEKHGYKVDIVFETNEKSIILEKEIEFIKLYGRQDLGLGTLVNFTDGGLDNFNTFSEKILEKRNKNLKFLNTREQIELKRKKFGTKITILNKNGEFVANAESSCHAAEIVNVNCEDVCTILAGKQITSKGYRFIKTSEYDKNKNYLFKKSGLREVIVTKKDGIFVGEFESVSEAARKLGLFKHLSGINYVLKANEKDGKYRIFKELNFKFK